MSATPVSFQPILDLRPRRSAGGLALRSATVVLWGGALLLLAAPALRLLPRLALTAAAVPLVVRPRRRRRNPPLQLCADSERGAVAQSLGISEADLFRARHAPRCTVHHDAAGQILALQGGSLWICATVAPTAPPAPLEPGVCR